MTAQILREAAALMRERAEAATDHVCPDWTRQAVRHIARNCEIECFHEEAPDSVHHDAEGEPNEWSRYNDAAHIASWHPAVALAVADWLDHDATAWEEYEKQGLGLPFARRERSLAVARAYLGTEATK